MTDHNNLFILTKGTFKVSSYLFPYLSNIKLENFPLYVLHYTSGYKKFFLKTKQTNFPINNLQRNEHGATIWHRKSAG